MNVDYDLDMMRDYDNAIISGSRIKMTLEGYDKKVDPLIWVEVSIYRVGSLETYGKN